MLHCFLYSEHQRLNDQKNCHNFGVRKRRAGLEKLLFLCEFRENSVNNLLFLKNIVYFLPRRTSFS